jgi:PKHD-type hydroxylase
MLGDKQEVDTVNMEALLDLPNPGNYITPPYVALDGLIDNTSLDLIADYCNQQGSMPATLGHRNQNTNIRQCDTRFHYINPATDWIFDLLEHAANTVNDRHFQFDLWGFDRFQYTVYNQPGSHYTYHSDMAFGPVTATELKPPRKLSFSLILSDPSEYSGGLFEIASNDIKEPHVIAQPRGRIIAFPSYMTHRVTPVITGVRKSIVVWATGPKFK